MCPERGQGLHSVCQTEGRPSLDVLGYKSGRTVEHVQVLAEVEVVEEEHRRTDGAFEEVVHGVGDLKFDIERSCIYTLFTTFRDSIYTKTLLLEVPCRDAERSQVKVGVLVVGVAHQCDSLDVIAGSELQVCENKFVVVEATERVEVHRLKVSIA